MTENRQAIDRTPPPVHLRIGAERRTAGSGGAHEHIDPATGAANAAIPLAGPAEVNEAVAVAQEAFESWRRTSPAIRRRLLLTLADLIEQNAEEFARRGALDNGTPLLYGRGFPINAAEWTRYYAGWADKILGDVNGLPTADGEFGYTIAKPYGVIGIIITWNGPLISLAMKIPAALAAGNTVVVKPSELTPFSAELFADLVERAGFPAGVVNVLPGDAAAGQALVEHPLVRKISFTGGPATARRILQSASATMKPTLLELGGKSANIVFDDADLDDACAIGTRFSLIALAGQGCAFATRMLVQDTVYDEVVARVTAIAESNRPGDPFEEGVLTGPVVNEDAVHRILGMIERAQRDGATLVTGGHRIGGELADGYYIEPTVFTDVDPQSELAQTEVFGPVLAIFRFRTEEEALELANSTPYSLSSYVQTRDLNRAIRLATELHAGQTLINGATNLRVARPFGGFGISGVGKEGGRHGLEEFLQVKSVGIVVG
ncbi:aldehyde dehydrogenase family protein [Microbacterium sp. No. 7]|uniref:aldehyde dehydrogenase family protein n=1 Tax=Microbacterium sp. No. 7 TaxID=1714373 RepID=UPI0006CFF9AD|nr:aldehyde dehydrogenase family protein [Microbacterium sp. No. 7]ALJ18885.1 aldehyde dehydrogenase [Microbacterium sp. No. 7]